MTRPPYLHNGDKVALLSPAYCPTAAQAAHAADALRSWGLEPVFGRHFRTSEADFEYAGTPEQRAADLRDALRDPSVRAIIPVRGGYGSLQLLDLLSPEDFTANPTWLVGYSDITTLLMASVSAGVVAVHGPMGATLDTSPDNQLCRLLFGESPSKSSRDGNILLGGNLSSVVPVLDTWAGKAFKKRFILFLEDVGEDCQHLDRLFRMLMGKKLPMQGVILGDFTDCRPMYGYTSAMEMMRQLFTSAGIPVLGHIQAGHGPVNLPFILGK